MVAIFFIYGLAFFVLGVSILIYPKKDSAFKLARELWMIGAFGLIHGVNEWLEMFILIHKPYELVLDMLGLPILAISFLFLVKFGIKNISEIKKKSKLRDALPAILTALWGILTLLSRQPFKEGVILARYLLAFPGTFFTAYALILQARVLKKENLLSIARNLNIAAAAFLAYGCFAGLTVPKARFFPAAVFNYETFLNLTGIPIQAFRALCAVIIAYNIIRLLAVFNWETKNKVISLLERVQPHRDKLELRVEEHIIHLVDINEELKHEITERKKANEQIKSLSLRYQAILSAVPDIIMEVDKNKVYTWANRAGFEFFGEDVIGKEAAFYFVGEQETYNKVEPLFKGDEDVIYVESWQRRQGGEKRLLAWWCRVLKDSGGNVTGALSTARDITEAKKVEDILKRDKEAFEKLVQARSEQLLETEKELDKARRLADMGMLAASVAHELRNPLAAIQIAAYNIKKKKGAGELLEKHLSNIEKKVAESDQIINNLLFYARLKSAHHERISIYDLLNECIDMAEKRFEGKNVVISRNFDSISELVIDADPLQMRELFNNIFNNAFDAISGKEGEIKIRVEQADASHVAIYIKDNGIGIDEENLSKIYDPFFTTKSKGTGLGLTVASQIVYLHNGAMDIQSKKGEWTEVTVVLPAKKKQK